MNLLRLIKNFLIFPLLLVVLSLLLPQFVSAQIPEPYVNCADTDSPEWHSLRPYQASPCKLPIDPDSEMSQLCGKDLIARDTFMVTPRDAVRCEIHSCPGTATCYYKYPREFWVTINPFESSYPIAGNTELIPEDEGNEPFGVIEELRLSYWKKYLPPKTEDYDEFEDYWIAYQEWRGKTCKKTPVIPLINKSLTICFDNPASPNFWAQLFPNVPYSSTEDREGKLVSTDIMFMKGDFSVEDLQTNWEKDRDERDEDTKNNESVLYFPHMEENVELSQILQSTYLTPKILNSEQPVTTPEPEPEFTNEERCVIANTRYNPGDQLFGEIIVGKVTYKAIFECDFPVYPPPICQPYGTCTVSGVFYSDLTTYVPLLEELWSKTVAGNASILKRFYPKIEAGSPIEKIEEIPSVSDVVYEAEAKGSNAKTTIETQNPEIYFPHLGSIYDYFLKGIQTALRPQDYPGVSAGLTDDTPIVQVDRLNEYISWYLNGTIYRAEQDPLSADDEEDVSRLINFSGPINKLLPQSVQWQKKEEQIKLAGKDNGRHDQIAACVFGESIPLLGIVGFPVACGENQEASVGKASTGSPPSPGTGTAECKDSMPSIPGSSSCKLTKTNIGGVSIPPTMKKIFETAGETYGVPPDLIAGVMFAEGGFEPRVTNPSCYGPYTEENIQDAALCEFPNCNPAEYNPPCNYDSTQGPGSCINGGTHFGPFQQCPNGYNPCNIYDAIMNAAKSLANARYASYSGLSSCLGYDLTDSTAKGSGCSKSDWSCEDVITALTNWEGSCNPGGHACNALSIYGSCGSQCP